MRFLETIGNFPMCLNIATRMFSFFKSGGAIFARKRSRVKNETREA
jgi:hypothetical protein